MSQLISVFVFKEIQDTLGGAPPPLWVVIVELDMMCLNLAIYIYIYIYIYTLAIIHAGCRRHKGRKLHLS